MTKTTLITVVSCLAVAANVAPATEENNTSAERFLALVRGENETGGGCTNPPKLTAGLRLLVPPGLRLPIWADRCPNCGRPLENLPWGLRVDACSCDGDIGPSRLPVIRVVSGANSH